MKIFALYSEKILKRGLLELSELPPEIIHEPWKMSEDQQTLYKTRLVVDYPEQMIELVESYERINSSG